MNEEFYEDDYLDEPEQPTYVAEPGEISFEEMESRVIEAIRQIYDPEIPVNIYDLGLIYTIDIRPDYFVFIRMTLTAPACPVAGILPKQVENKVRVIKGVSGAHVELTFDPPWGREMLTEEAKLALGLY